MPLKTSKAGTVPSVTVQVLAKTYEVAYAPKNMPTLAVTNFNIVCATLGGFITLFGLVSYLFKERLFLSESCEYPILA